MTQTTFTSLEQATDMVITAMQSGDGQLALNSLQQALASYSQNGLLLFLYASELAQQQQYDLALTVFIDSVSHAPQLHIARFQLCLLAASADKFTLLEQHLPTLTALGQQHYLGCFAAGLTALLNDQISQANTLIGQGINLNQDNLALNHDMQQLLVRFADTTDSKKDISTERASNTLSSSLLLDIYKNTH